MFFFINLMSKFLWREFDTSSLCKPFPLNGYHKFMRNLNLLFRNGNIENLCDLISLYLKFFRLCQR